MPENNTPFATRFLDLSAEQIKHAGLAQRCPRCGSLKINPNIMDNPISARAFGIRICRDCHKHEQFGTENKPLEQWAAARSDFSLLPLENAKQAYSAGCDCWAWAYDWPRGATMPSLKQAPIHGVLARSNRDIGKPDDMAEWFVPYVKNTKRPAWTKAFRVECLNIHTDRSDAFLAYNNAVDAVARRFEDTARMIRKDIARAGKPKTAAAAVAGTALSRGQYGWSCIVITENATAILSGGGREDGADDAAAVRKALAMAAGQAVMQDIQELTVWTSCPAVHDDITKIGANDLYDGVSVKNPVPDDDPDLHDKMRRFLLQAVDMAYEQAGHIERTG